jgi:hypothetical protein
MVARQLVIVWVAPTSGGYQPLLAHRLLLANGRCSKIESAKHAGRKGMTDSLKTHPLS